MGDYAGAISNIESGGRYDLLGPVTRTGDRAFGRYQIMGANVGPWTLDVLGKQMTPHEFLANPQAQDAVFNARFGNYVSKYGPEGAAKAWFAGEKGMNNPNATDQLGTSVQQYGQRFMAGLGQPSAPQGQPAQASGPVFAPPEAPSQSQPTDIADIFSQQTPIVTSAIAAPSSPSQPFGSAENDSVDKYLEDQAQQRLFQPRTTQHGKPKPRRA